MARPEESGDLKELNVERRIKLKGIKICRASSGVYLPLTWLTWPRWREVDA